jgi:hypothetical protein
MSDLTEILIENLQLRRLLCERIFIKWKDQSGEPCTLGSRTKNNKKDLKFLMAAYCDKEGHIHIHFSIKVSISRDGKKHEIEMLLVVPPDADFSKALTPCSISTINALSHLDATAIHDAGISDSVHVIRIKFNLITEGFVVMKKKTAATFKSWNKTSKELIRRFESLSNTKTFTVYIKPNDYAREGLKKLNTCTATDIHKTNMKEMYIQQDAILVEWSRFDRVLPPPYTDNPPQLFPEVQVRQSPPNIFEQETPSLDTTEEAIGETPARSPISPNSTSVHGIFSGCEESSESLGSEANLDDIEKDIRIDFDVDSDEEELAREQLANLDYRELNRPFDYDLKVSQPLPEVQVPRSPTTIFEQKTLSINTIETAIAETPARIPATPNSISVHGIFSPICEESSDIEVDWDDIEETWRNAEEASRNIEIDPDIHSDQERLVNLNSRDPSQQFNSREQSQQFNYDSEVSKILESKFMEWMETAGQINPNIHEHKRLITKLLILGNCIRTSNSGVFDATILWCSTIFLFDPFDSDTSPELWRRNLWLLSDMARLIKWANKVHYSAEMNPLLVDHFLKLGDTARTIALHPEYSYDSYERQKRVCTTQVIIKLGKPVISIGGETSKTVSRKRLGTDSNRSKRVKI